MRLDEYVSKNKMSLAEFNRLGDDRLTYDFLKECIYPDSSSLTHEIYKNIFPWYRPKYHSGDSLNTYRSAILRKYYGKAYANLGRDDQEKILQIIKRHTLVNSENGGLLFEFDFEANSKKEIKCLCNNYQLGNFGIWVSRKYGINTTRAQIGYDDFFDLTLNEIKNYYEGKFADNSLSKAIKYDSDYFNQFSGFDEFIEDNFLQDFLNEKGEVIKLSEIDEFENYVETINNIIQKRGKRIINKLDSSFTTK
ncbi:DUF6994 family protein [Floricoccus penangensis]|uniref:DUF6994 family protein n=1 Tax=Floricoccus penangensis TaxID=1859475 RepID=UPI00203F0396|nr:hypothetical protein [Floricoccus penangensis]URZ87642.1 hypothetical protein KIW23_00915 [Floricoccus penangensis]